MKRTNLDEMQEQKLLSVEKSCFWLAYYGLLLSILIQAMLGLHPSAIFGECAILLVISVRLLIGGLRNGIWDRKLEPSLLTYFLGSLVCGILVGVIVYFILGILMDGAMLWQHVCVIAVGTAAICFVLMCICGAIYKKRREKLDSED